jgi:hypothetical protein
MLIRKIAEKMSKHLVGKKFTKDIVTCNVILRRVRETTVAVGKKKICITYCECVFVALLTLHVKRMRSIIMPSESCQGLHYFSTLSHKRQNFSEKVTQCKMLVLFFSKLLSRAFLTLRSIQRDIVINVKTSLCKMPDIFVQF